MKRSPTQRTNLGWMGIVVALLAGCGGPPEETTGGGQTTTTAGGMAGTGGHGATTGGGGSTGCESQCCSADDCPAPQNECLQATCENGVCATEPVARGAPATEQIDGDCKLAVCDGDGNVALEDDDTDPPDDGQDCTVDGCDAGNPSNMPKAAGEACAQDRGVVCDGAGSCVECLSGVDCGTGFCADAVCCDAACDAPCEACSAAKKGGGADGTCGPMAAGTDPDGDCDAMLASSCGATGVCDGAGQCEVFAAGTSCGDGPTCAGGVQTAADTCDGLGQCVQGATSGCGAYACGAMACNASCAGDGDCAVGAVCGPMGTCLLGPGQGCSQGAECATGFCVDGVCCNTSCLATCQACDVAGSAGVCAPVAPPGTPDDFPANACAGASACDGAGNCKIANGEPCALDGECASGDCTAGSCCVGYGCHLWSKRFGDAAAQFGRVVAVDGSDDVVVTGGFKGVVDFGGGAITGASLNEFDIFVMKLQPDGAHVWSKGLSVNGVAGGSPPSPGGVAFDGANDVAIAGWFDGTMNMGGGALTSAGLDDVFVGKLDAAGNHLWSKRFGSVGYDSAVGVDVDAAGDLFVIGSFQDSVTFGGSALTSAGSDDVFVTKLDPAGNHVWSKSFGGALAQHGDQIELDATGAAVITGHFYGGINFGGNNLVGTQEDIFLAKLDASGNHVWSKDFGGFGEDRPAQHDGLAVDAQGNIILWGQFDDLINFGGGVLAAEGLTDLFVAKFTEGGAHLWSKHFPSSGAANNAAAWGVAVDAAGNIFLNGRTNQSIDFGGGPLQKNFFVKLDGNGNHLWSKAFDIIGYTVATDSGGNSLWTGSFSAGSPVDFGGDPLTSAGGTDVFAVKFSP